MLTPGGDCCASQLFRGRMDLPCWQWPVQPPVLWDRPIPHQIWTGSHQLPLRNWQKTRGRWGCLKTIWTCNLQLLNTLQIVPAGLVWFFYRISTLDYFPQEYFVTVYALVVIKINIRVSKSIKIYYQFLTLLVVIIDHNCPIWMNMKCNNVGFLALSLYYGWNRLQLTVKWCLKDLDGIFEWSWGNAKYRMG